MKRKLFALLLTIITVAVVVSGCGGGAPVPKKETPKPAAEVPVKICTVAGIGDTLDDWIKDHGKPNQEPNSMQKNFRKDALIALFGESKRAINVTIQATPDGKLPVKLEELLPKDGKLVSSKESKDGMVAYTTKEYTSEAIKKYIKGNLTGHYTLIDEFDQKTGKYIKTTLDCNLTIAEIQKAKAAK